MAEERTEASANAASGRSAESPWCSIDEAAAYVGVSRRTVYNWIAKGKVAVGRTPGGAVRIRRDQLVRED